MSKFEKVNDSTALINGVAICRRSWTCQCGRRFEAAAPVIPPPGPVHSGPKCIQCQLDEAIGDRAAFGYLIGDPVTLQAELDELDGSRKACDRLRVDQIRAELGTFAGKPDPAFPLGKVLISRLTIRAGINLGHVEPLLARHRAGDFGEIGPLPDKPSVAACWSPDHAIQRERNAVAIESRHGFVRSSYSLRFVYARTGLETTDAVRILTCLAGDLAETFIADVSRDHVAL